MIWTLQDELKRYIEDRDMAEMDLDSLHQEMCEIEYSDPDYENNDNWNGLWHEVTELENTVNDLSRCIEDLEDRIADGEVDM
jgi:hypothetical protein